MPYILLVLSLVLTGCAGLSQRQPAAFAAGRSPAQNAGLVKVELLVTGDANCDRKKTPEAFSVLLDPGQPVDGVHSATVLSPAGFLKAPFKPLSSEKSFLNKLIADRQLLKDQSQLLLYQKLAEKLFVAELKPPVDIRPVASKYGSVVFMHPLVLNELMAFQSWYMDELAPQTNDLLRVTTTGNPDEPLLPLILFGSVTRTGHAPRFSVEFDPKDSVITGNPQNEVHDTTLCQLRKGIFDVDQVPQADITIVRILGVQN